MSRWEALPLDILYLEIEYLDTYEDIELFCSSDSYLDEKICQDPDGKFWQNLFKQTLSEDINLDSDETVMSKYVKDKQKIKDLIEEGAIDKSYDIKGFPQYYQLYTFIAEKGYVKLLDNIFTGKDLKSLYKLKEIPFSLEVLDFMLFDAIEAGSLSMVKYLVEHSANLHAYNDVIMDDILFSPHVEILEYVINSQYANNINSLQEFINKRKYNDELDAIKSKQKVFIIDQLNKNNIEIVKQNIPNIVELDNLPLLNFLVKKGIHINIDDPAFDRQIMDNIKHHQFAWPKFIIDYMSMNLNQPFTKKDLETSIQYFIEQANTYNNLSLMQYILRELIEYRPLVLNFIIDNNHIDWFKHYIEDVGPIDKFNTPNINEILKRALLNVYAPQYLYIFKYLEQHGANFVDVVYDITQNRDNSEYWKRNAIDILYRLNTQPIIIYPKF